MGFGDRGAFGIGSLLVRFIMAMIGVDNVEELADFVLEVESLLLDVGFCRDGGRLVGVKAVETRMTPLNCSSRFSSLCLNLSMMAA